MNEIDSSWSEIYVRTGRLRASKKNHSSEKRASAYKKPKVG